MKIGTDMNLQTCWQEGYMIMEYKVRELFPFGRDGGLDPNCCVRFYHSDGGVMRRGISGITKILDICFSWHDLVEMYNRHHEAIDSMCGYGPENPRIGMDKPDEYIMLNLASDIDAYCGLE